MTINDINDIFGLFEQGFIVGAMLASMAFILGWGINMILSLVKNA